MAKMRKKADLPTKICPICQKPFAWRKKWERDWEHVVYCSKRCAAAVKTCASNTSASTRG